MVSESNVGKKLKCVLLIFVRKYFQNAAQLCSSSIFFVFCRRLRIHLTHQNTQNDTIMKNFTFLLMLLGYSLAVFAGVSPAEKKALMRLNQATNGNQWTHKWDFSKPVEQWHGVTVKNDKVVAIDLTNNNLSGELPKEIGSLVHLEKLVLFRNKITGAIPSTIGNLKSLKSLNIAFNKIAGKIPAEIGNATSLQSVELYMNMISGTLPAELGKLSNLEVLSLFNNEIEGNIPNELYGLKSLKVLLLSSNKLSGKLSPNISNLKSLENLSLFENNLEGNVPWDLEKLRNLKEMNISYNKFNGVVSKQLAQLDMMNMTMINEQGVATTLKVESRSNTALASDDE